MTTKKAYEQAASSPASLITYDEMKAALERAVAERGEGFVYPEEWKRLGNPCDTKPSCVYRNLDDTPSCIVGLAMSYLKPELRLEEFQGASEVLLGVADKHARCLAQKVQWGQDASKPWGESLAYALSHDWLVPTSVGDDE